MLTAICLLSVTLWLIYKFWTSNFGYWKERGFPYLEAHFPWGTMREATLVSKYNGYIFQEMYNKLDGEPYGGLHLMRRPVLLVRDPQILQHIFVKDFSFFRDRQRIGDAKAEILTQHLFNLNGDEWKALRTKLTPTFTSGKLKVMFTLFQACADQLNKVLESMVEKEALIDIKDTMANFTMDIIGTCAFGLEINAMESNDNKFRKMFAKVFPPNIEFTAKLKILANTFFPKLVNFYKFRFIEKEVEDFLVKVVHDTVSFRENNNVTRNDFLDLLIQLKDKEKEGSDFVLTEDSMVAQCFVFFAAGFETSSSVLSFAFYELALHPEIQEKVRREVDTVSKKHGGITYQALQEMTYLEQVAFETMRKYPTLPMLMRHCVAPYQIPDGSGRILDEGTRVIIPTYAIHHDPKYYPDPEIFDPDRFSPERKSSIPPCTFLPFGEGPRICIGMRFGLLQTKMGLATLLQNYELLATDKTPKVLKMAASFLVTTVDGPIYLQIKSRDQAA